MNDSQPIRPAWFHLLGAGVVLLGCELGMGCVWGIVALAVRDGQEVWGCLLIALLFLLLFGGLAYRQYEAVFRRNATAASTLTQALVGLLLLFGLPFLELTGLMLSTDQAGWQPVWYVMLSLTAAIFLATATNWSWSNRLRASRTAPLPTVWQWSLSTMLIAMALCSVQFALASLLVRSWRE